jgi:hypothetical protein
VHLRSSQTPSCVGFAAQQRSDVTNPCTSANASPATQKNGEGTGVQSRRSGPRQRKRGRVAGLARRRSRRAADRRSSSGRSPRLWPGWSVRLPCGRKDSAPSSRSPLGTGPVRPRRRDPPRVLTCPATTVIEERTLYDISSQTPAPASIPDEVVDALIPHGAPGTCRDRIADYVEGGVQVPVIALLPHAGADLGWTGRAAHRPQWTCTVGTRWLNLSTSASCSSATRRTGTPARRGQHVVLPQRGREERRRHAPASGCADNPVVEPPGVLGLTGYPESRLDGPRPAAQEGAPPGEQRVPLCTVHCGDAGVPLQPERHHLA